VKRAYMKLGLMKVVLTLTIGLLGVPLIHAQLNNSCTYSYSFGKGDKLFAFCLTPYGTLASLQGSSGDNLLDPVNPIEGWVMCDDSGYDLFNSFQVVPGLGLGGSPPSVYQPKGVGKLPIVFGNGIYSGVSVTADLITKTVVFTMPFPKIGSQYEYASGPATRVMGLGSTSATLSTSSVAAFGYVAPGDLVQLSAARKEGGTTSPGYPRVSPGAFSGASACGVNFQPNTPGQGFIYNDPSYQASVSGTIVWTYRIF
jgi:hypothetical protein